MTEPEPVAERLEQIRRALENQGFTHLLAAVMEEVAVGRVVISVARRPELLQHSGLFHGGVMAYLVDNATTAAAGTVCRPGEGVLTRRVQAEHFGARARRTACLHRGGDQARTQPDRGGGAGA